jgi:hypothetical protein
MRSARETAMQSINGSSPRARAQGDPWHPLAVALMLLALLSPPAFAAPRIALVIGNAAYAYAPLRNPVNDAREMAVALQDAGFEVDMRLDVGQRDMLAALRAFGQRLQAGGGVGLFYFAGHGMQIKGRNYLIPVGTDIASEDEVAYQALDAQAVLDKMESAGNGMNLLILDACRNNPFLRNTRAASQGLAPMDAPVGTLVAFATAPGSVAVDGDGRHDLFTLHLLQAIRQPGLKVEEAFKQVRSAVRRDSRVAARQRRMDGRGHRLVVAGAGHVGGDAGTAVAAGQGGGTAPPRADRGGHAVHGAALAGAHCASSASTLVPHARKLEDMDQPVWFPAAGPAQVGRSRPLCQLGGVRRQSRRHPHPRGQPHPLPEPGGQ